MDQEYLADLIGLIYDAPLDGSWHAALDAIESALYADHIVLITQYIASGMHDAVGSSRRLAVEARYCEQYAHLNTVWPVLARQPLYAAATDAALLDMEKHRRDIFFNEFRRPNGLLLAAGGVVLRTSDAIVALSVHRSDEGRSFEAPDLAAIAALLPHLGRATRLRERLAACQQQASSAQEVLERLPLAVLVVDERGRLVQANAAAERVLRAQDGLSLVQGRLVAADRAAAGLLSAAISAATARPTHVPGARDGMLRVERPSGRSAYLLDVLPLAGPPRWAGVSRTLCTVFVADPDGRPCTAERVLRKIFGLTAAEARVALALGSGEGLAGLSQQFGVGLATTRTHLAGALSKTGLHRQAELVRLVERCAVLARRKDG